MMYNCAIFLIICDVHILLQVKLSDEKSSM